MYIDAQRGHPTKSQGAAKMVKSKGSRQRHARVLTRHEISALPKAKFVDKLEHWQPKVDCLQLKVEGCTVSIVDKTQLDETWPRLSIKNNDAWVAKHGRHELILQTVEQGRYYVADEGIAFKQRRRLGLGVKVASPRGRPDLSGGVVAERGVRVAAFPIVARLYAPVNDALQTKAIEETIEMLVQMGHANPTPGIGTLHTHQHDTATRYLYDRERSTGYLVNSSWRLQSKRTGKKATKNLDIKLSTREWAGFLTSTEALKLGDHLFVSYGGGSSHYNVSEEEHEERPQDERRRVVDPPDTRPTRTQHTRP